MKLAYLNLDKDQIEIKNRKIKLKIFREEDVDYNYLKWMKDSEICKYIEKANKDISINDLKLFVSTMYNSKDNFFFRILDIRTQKHIGNVRIGPINGENMSTAFGILIGDLDSHNKGYASDVFNLILQFCEKKIEAKEIRFSCVEENVQAIKLYKKFGCRMDPSKEKFKKDGKLLNKVIFSKKFI